MEFNSRFQDEISTHGRASLWNKIPMDTWRKRLRGEMKRLGWKAPELVRRTDLSLDMIQSYLKPSGKTDNPRGDTLHRIAAAVGVNYTWLRDNEGPRISSIPVVGYTSAGETWTPIDDHAKGAALERVNFEIDWDDPIAIRIRGVSMEPVFRDGNILICDRRYDMDESMFLNEDCAVMTATGESYVKRVMRGGKRGFYSLHSYNPGYSTKEDVKLEWVAPVIWVKRS